jgi:hypothetical protein
MDWFVIPPPRIYIVIYSRLDTGKAYHFNDIIVGRFYYPRDPGKVYDACKMWGRKLSYKPKMDYWERPRTRRDPLKRERSANGSS